MQYRAAQLLSAITAGAVAMLGCVVLAYGANLELPVPKVTIYPGDVIAAEALGTQIFGPGVERMPVIRSRDDVVGKVARRTLIPGKPIPLNAIRVVDAVSLGKQVQLIFEAGGLMITGIGVAQQNAGVGDQVSVRNSDSGQTIRGVVQADGSVRVGP
jgi:flagellar basal body P-ring formation protein FlgA